MTALPSKVYVAGPMRGLPGFNFPAFDAATYQLEQLGYVVFNPAQRDRDEGFDARGMTGFEDLAAAGFDLREALAADTDWIAREADGLYLLEGWERSSGARAELALAAALGLKAALEEQNTGGRPEWRPATEVYAETLGVAEVPPSGAVPPAGWQVTPAVARRDATLPDGEVRLTSATGGQKGTKEARFDLIPAGPLTTLARLYGRGALKYDDDNWRRGYDWRLSFAAMQRHAWQFWDGEDLDEETGLPHLASVAWHAFTLLEFMEHHRGFDTRYASPSSLVDAFAAAGVGEES